MLTVLYEGVRDWIDICAGSTSSKSKREICHLPNRGLAPKDVRGPQAFGGIGVGIKNTSHWSPLLTQDQMLLHAFSASYSTTTTKS